MKRLENLCSFSIRNQKLLYRGSVHGFDADAFHRHCDRIPNTLSLLKSSNGNVFGGFTTQTWESSGDVFKRDDRAFIFTFKNEANKPEKMKINPYKIDKAICCNPKFGPNFGQPHNICTYDRCNENAQSYSIFGETFLSDSRKSNEYFAGSQYFKVAEIEVFVIA